MQQQQEINPEREQLRQQERSLALKSLAQALIAEHRSVNNTSLLVFSGLILVGLFFLFVVVGFDPMVLFYAVSGTILVLSTRKHSLPGARRRRSPRWVRKFRENLQVIFGERYRQLAAHAEPLLEDGIYSAELPAVLQLGRALFPLEWWMSGSVASAHIACLTTLHRLLGQASEEALAVLRPEDKAYLLQLLHRLLKAPTGWYLDTELPIRLFLALASANEPGATALAEIALKNTHEPRLAQAAQEYLDTIESRS